ncbi:MAG TPA: hypothetical protein VJO53_02390 [Candidatus Acidoferrales bacterium]|nr:hypothetical protein [Candidatus Acidoferrales bacterium]
MPRSKEQLLSILKEQTDLLHSSLRAFYQGAFAQSLHVATTIRVLAHETGRNKPLLKQLRTDGLDLAIPEHADDAKPGQEEFLRFAVGLRLGPGQSVAPALDLESSHYAVSTVGAWWGRTLIAFLSRLGTQVVYKRKQIILMLANREGGAHVHEHENPDYMRLLTDLPLHLIRDQVEIETPDLARFLAAQSGVEMLDCLRRNFFPDLRLPSKWECGTVPPVATYLDQISLTGGRVLPPLPQGTIRITRR